jgi:hypothetical protein
MLAMKWRFLESESVTEFMTVEIMAPLRAFDTAEHGSMLAPIITLHRHKDGYVSFAVSRDDGDDFRPLVSIRAKDLANCFPAFREQLLKDAYVAINADYRVRRQGPEGAAYGYPLHRIDQLRYLCAAYADIDFYKLGLSWSEALGRVMKLEESGEIPAPSVIVKSGRGLWLLYMLHDPDDVASAPGAFPEKLEMYYRLQRHIVGRLAGVGADACATDAVRHVRVPDSLHTGADEKVNWWLPGTGASLHSYSLAELSALFGVKPPQRHARERKALENPNRRRGWEALNARRLREFNLLREMRGGFLKGCRNSAAVIYSWLLRCNGVSREDGSFALHKLADEFRPRLPVSQIRAATKLAYGPTMRRMKDQTISDRLGITPQESARLEKLPPAARYPIQPPTLPVRPKEARASRIMSRRAALVELVPPAGHVPPLRELSAKLRALGHDAGLHTVLRDMRYLKLESGRSRGARSEAASKQSSLFSVS